MDHQPDGIAGRGFQDRRPLIQNSRNPTKTKKAPEPDKQVPGPFGVCLKVERGFRRDLRPRPGT